MQNNPTASQPIAETLFSVNLSEKDIARFWSYVEKTPDGCWRWKNKPNIGGYGMFGQQRKVLHGAHRVSFFIANGPFDSEKFVCHTCDNPICVRPDHLWLGTAQDNNRDRSIKNRTRKGDAHHWHYNKEQFFGTRNAASKLTDEVVIQIRKDRKELKMTYYKLAEKYGVSFGNIWKITSGRNWKHLL